MGKKKDKAIAIAAIWLITSVSLYSYSNFGSQIILLFSAFLVGDFVFSFLKTGKGNFRVFGRFLSAGQSYLTFYLAIVLSSIGGAWVSSILLQILTPSFSSLQYDLIIGFILSALVFADLEIWHLF